MNGEEGMIEGDQYQSDPIDQRDHMNRSDYMEQRQNRGRSTVRSNGKFLHAGSDRSQASDRQSVDVRPGTLSSDAPSASRASAERRDSGVRIGIGSLGESNERPLTTPARNQDVMYLSHYDYVDNTDNDVLYEYVDGTPSGVVSFRRAISETRAIELDRDNAGFSGTSTAEMQNAVRLKEIEEQRNIVEERLKEIERMEEYLKHMMVVENRTMMTEVQNNERIGREIMSHRKGTNTEKVTFCYVKRPESNQTNDRLEKVIQKPIELKTWKSKSKKKSSTKGTTSSSDS